MKVFILAILLASAAAGEGEPPPDFHSLFDTAKGPATTSSRAVTQAATGAGNAGGGAGFSEVLLSKCFDPKFRTAGSDLDKKCTLLEASAFEHALGIYKYQHDLYAWQQASSIILFWVVMALVVCGIVFAGIQFAQALRVRERAVVAPGTRTPVPEPESAEVSRLKELAVHLDISAKGMEVSSSVLGVIILVISLAFLYLYLHNVYPIVSATPGPT